MTGDMRGNYLDVKITEPRWTEDASSHHAQSRAMHTTGSEQLRVVAEAGRCRANRSLG